MENRLSGHSVYRTEYHVVWIPKYRRRILSTGVREYLKKLWPKILRGIPGVEMIEENIQVDHIHAVVIIPPKYSVSDVIGRIKGQSASKLRKKFTWLEEVYWKENVVWSPGYFVSTIGLNEEQIIKYVKWQERQDSGQAKLEL
ncbi:MAG TPA: IS200/IS605 family transposase [Saprospiraceae bacterium]|nr:IS200/IS605 family transposase [Saprospiraceae bacterium]